MAASSGRSWSGRAALALLPILARAGNGVSAAEPRAGTEGVQCRMIVRDFLQRAPVMRRSDQQIVGLLDARRYRQAESQLRSEVSRYPDAWAGYTLGQYAPAVAAIRRLRGPSE